MNRATNPIRVAVCLLMLAVVVAPARAKLRDPISSSLFSLPSSLFLNACCLQQKDSRSNQYEPQAIRLLAEMADAYAHLSALRQETEYTSIVAPLVPLPEPPPQPATSGDEDEDRKKPGANNLLNSERKLDRKLRLSFHVPNRLRLEIEDTDESGKVLISYWVCDGKQFWTYKPEKNLFSRENAPKKIRDFAKLAHMTSGSLEILMLMGINPFERVQEQTELVRYVGQDTVRGVAVEVVAMSADLELQATETRFYIGAEDHLLYRLVSENSQKARPPRRIGVGSPLDELAAPNTAPPPPVSPDGTPVLTGVLMKSCMICDNKIETDPKFEFGTFAYQPPANALYLTNPDVHKKPMTLKQRIAELSRAAKREKKAPPRIYRY